MMTEKEISELPLRERKKEIIRQAIVKNAERLFEERGYDHVTVVEIADAANISVKTLFTYFRSKEDLLFQDSGLVSAILTALRERPKKCSPAQAVVQTLINLLRESGTATESLAGFQRGFGDSEALQSRILRLWAEFEFAIADELAREAKLDKQNADIRFQAAQLVTLIRTSTWKEVLDIALSNHTNSIQAVEEWLLKAAKRIA